MKMDRISKKILDNIKEYWNAMCGYDPIIIDEISSEMDMIVDEMPNYPSDGSIRSFKGVIVIKLSD